MSSQHSLYSGSGAPASNGREQGGGRDLPLSEEQVLVELGMLRRTLPGPAPLQRIAAADPVVGRSCSPLRPRPSSTHDYRDKTSSSERERSRDPDRDPGRATSQGGRRRHMEWQPPAPADWRRLQSPPGASPEPRGGPGSPVRKPPGSTRAAAPLSPPPRELCAVGTQTDPLPAPSPRPAPAAISPAEFDSMASLLSTRERQLREQDRELAQCRAQAEERERELAQCRAQAEERERELAEHAQRLRERERELAECGARLREQDRALQEARRGAEELRRRVDELGVELQHAREAAAAAPPHRFELPPQGHSSTHPDAASAGGQPTAAVFTLPASGDRRASALLGSSCRSSWIDSPDLQAALPGSPPDSRQPLPDPVGRPIPGGQALTELYAQPPRARLKGEFLGTPGFGLAALVDARTGSPRGRFIEKYPPGTGLQALQNTSLGQTIYRFLGSRTPTPPGSTVTWG